MCSSDLNDQDISTSIYSCKGAYHPGEDWNLFVEDLGKPIHAIADGIVLFNQSQQWRKTKNDSWISAGFGNVVIVGHKLADGKIVASVYAHMQDKSSFLPKAVIYKGDVLGKIGGSWTAPLGVC